MNNNHRPRVVITGLGAISPLGLTVAEFWAGLLAGRSGITRVTQFDASQLPCQIASEVKGFDPNDMEKELERPAKESAPTSALVFKIVADPFVGRLSYFRVYSGKVSKGATLFNATEAVPTTKIYTRFVVVDEETIQHRSYAAARGKQRPLPNRDILRMFEPLRVTDQFLLKTNTREMLFRK